MSPKLLAKAVLPLLSALLLAVAGPAYAADGRPVPVDDVAEAPAGPAILAVLDDSGAVHGFDLRTLEAVGLHRSTTSTYWPNDTGPFEGVLLSDLLAAAGLAETPAVRITALDGYAVVVPRDDWTRWPILLVTRIDGKPLTVAERGPLRVIYPRDMDEALVNRAYALRSIWMIERIEPAPADAVKPINGE